MSPAESISDSTVQSDSEDLIVNDNESIEEVEDISDDSVSSLNNNAYLHSDSQESMTHESIKKVVIQVSLFLTPFQLCYRISKRGIKLLRFLKSLLSWLLPFAWNLKVLNFWLKVCF